ncbi:MAG: hypothetical protein GX139_10340 [Armatimonadetes bacterium]|jgi:hypothetical protein|nr:hypothetical protein [Armatimonadota bacterium]
MMLLIIAAGLLLMAAGLSVAADNEGRFVQDRFAIGFWVDPPAEEITDARYKEIADAGFTFVLGAFGPKNEKDVAKQLKLCEKYGMKAIVRDLNPEKRPDSPACWGYYIVDEPGVSAIPDIKARIDSVRKQRPGKVGYFNLNPDYAPLSVLGTSSYDEYIKRFAEETGCDVLCMDYYPLMTPTADGRDGYCGNLAVMRKYSLQQNIPHWNFFNTMPFGPHNDPTESQLRWQIFTSLAYGAKGVLYFCYWTPRGWEFPKGGAIITAEGHRTRHYDQAKRINAAIGNLGPTLMQLTSLDVIRVKPDDDAAELLKDTPIRQISSGDYLVGVFKHSDGRRVVLLNNYDFNYGMWPTVKFDLPADKVLEVDPADGREKPVRDDSPDTEGLQISLDSGEGRLFILPARRIP